VGWNVPGCYAVYNHTRDVLLIENGAAGNPKLEVPAGTPGGAAGIRSYGGFVIPWCMNSPEISSYALRFRIGPADPVTTERPGRFYLFQDWNIKVVSWTPWNDARPRYDDRIQGGAGVANAVDIIVREVAPDSFSAQAVKLW
jgi:hypothetical protein